MLFIFHSLAVSLLCVLLVLGLYCLRLTHTGAVFHSAVPWLADVSAGVYVDFTAAVMLCATAWVGLMVYLYSMAYMRSTMHPFRYFALLVFAVVAMVGLVVAENLVLLFVGWELVGWASYGLISFERQLPAAAVASTRVWLTNQLGSVSLLAGILLVGIQEGAWAWPALHAPVGRWTGGLLLGGVVAKSAQFPLSYWLPAAMVAPAPASALLHAATLVSAGAYLLLRVAGLLEADVLACTAGLGGTTALLSACAAWQQRDIKRMLAYSTASQLGLVVMAVGVGDGGAGLRHLVTHAAAKACLFLCAGAVTRFLQGATGLAVTDMRRMGGLRTALPGVFYPYALAAWGLMGLPGSAGFLSKEAILDSTWAWAQQLAHAGQYGGYAVFGLAWGASCLSVGYVARQWWWVFEGTPQWAGGRAWLPGLMQLSLVALAVCQIGWWETPSAAAVANALLTAGLGLGLAWAVPQGNGWCLDGLSDAVARRVMACARGAAWTERTVVGAVVQGISIGYVTVAHAVHWLDGRLMGAVAGIAAVPWWLGRLHGLTQQGHWQQTLWWMLMGMGMLLCTQFFLYFVP